MALSAAWPAVRGALVADGWRADTGALDTFFGTMPSVAASAGIEVRLGGDPRVDAGAVFARSDLGEADLPEVCAWAGAAAPLVRRWWSGEAPLLWVEADATEAGLKPFGFVTVIPELMNRGAHGPAEQVLARAQHFLGAAPVDDIRAALDALDGAGRLLHVAALPAWRGGGAVCTLSWPLRGLCLGFSGWGGEATSTRSPAVWVG